MRNHNLKHKRNNLIKLEYNKLAAKKIGKAQKYKHAAILELLSQKYYLTPNSIQHILNS